jgi:UDP-N-acetylglucosamine diphosphorylase/glucosamine-1-phosphate N-acetyltransferase
MHVVIFEGTQWPTFAPVSLNRPVFMLSSGMSTLFEKQVRHFAPTRLTLWVRPDLVESCANRLLPNMTIPAAINEPLGDEPALLVSGRTLQLRHFRPPREVGTVLRGDDGFVRQAYVKAPGLSHEDVLANTDRWQAIRDLTRAEPQSPIVESLSDLISSNEESLIEDFTQLHGDPRPLPKAPVHYVGEDIWVGEGAKLEPGVVLDASKGPVVLADHVVVGANSVLYGPCYLAPHAKVRPLTIVRGGTTIGRLCKVGGEVENSILMGHSNKGHDGYLGHSYLGKWVNLGASTVTSNLKTTYGQVTIHRGSAEIPTGRQFFGSVVGDHVKTAVGTRLMTGTYVGFCSMVGCSAIAPRFVPSFTFLTDHGAEPYRPDKAEKVMRAAYARRDIAWTVADDHMLQSVLRTAPQIER